MSGFFGPAVTVLTNLADHGRSADQMILHFSQNPEGVTYLKRHAAATPFFSLKKPLCGNDLTLPRIDSRFRGEEINAVTRFTMI